MNNLIGNIVLIISLIIFSNNLTAQSHDDHDDHDDHEHPMNEIGIGNSLSYLAGEQKYAYGLHIHLLRAIEHSKFGYGLGYEQIYDEHKHRTLGIIGSYRPISPLMVTVSPGVLFPNEENAEYNFALHSEIVYEFEIGSFHIGPALEFATTFEEYHIGAGFHVGFGF
ncbi:MAG: hypothetical protein K9H49_03855 [Bacteroidales bacterium]|nr:hypothetical protein [Bacteroidales bacterium]MCF8389425.1 hypothetical protein [Bacteroidales bacterium]